MENNLTFLLLVYILSSQLDISMDNLVFLLLFLSLTTDNFNNKKLFTNKKNPPSASCEQTDEGK